MNFIATEYVKNNYEPTGTTEIYQANTVQDAVLKCLYTRKLSNGNAKLGPSGRVIHSNNSLWTVTTNKEI